MKPFLFRLESKSRPCFQQEAEAYAGNHGPHLGKIAAWWLIAILPLHRFLRQLHLSRPSCTVDPRIPMAGNGHDKSSLRPPYIWEQNGMQIRMGAQDLLPNKPNR